MSNASDETKIAVLQNDITYIRRQVDDIQTKVSSQYVSKDEFEPIKRLVYGMVGLIAAALVAAAMRLLIK